MGDDKARGIATRTRAVLLCKDKRFWEYLGVSNAEDAAEEIYEYCSIKSRGELAHNADAQKKFKALDRDFMQWKNPVDEQYADNLSREY